MKESRLSLTLDNKLFNQLASEAGLHYLSHHLECIYRAHERRYQLLITLPDGTQYSKFEDTKGRLVVRAYTVMNLIGDAHFKCKINTQRSIP